MQKLLIALSRWFSKLAKQPQIEYNETPQLSRSGAFVNQTLASLEIYTDELYNEEDDFTITIQYACGCTSPVYRLGEEYGFGCKHCDSVCTIKSCADCNNLFSVDFGDPDANL